jgi:ABC-type multidrug transport system ATPase subunit
MIGELAADGRAILLISSEMPELLALCDRILVMSEGHLTADIPRARRRGGDHDRRRARESANGCGHERPQGPPLPPRGRHLVMIVLFCLAVGSTSRSS